MTAGLLWRSFQKKARKRTMTTTLDIALIRWSVVCRQWDALSSNSAPILGAFLAGWYWRDMGNELPGREQLGTFVDSFRVGWHESDAMITIQQREKKHGNHTEI